MSLAVVRCPACRGESRVAVDSLGHMVGCPRCQSPFVAEEEIPVVQPTARPAAPAPRTSSAASRNAAAVPVGPRRRRSEASRESEPEPSSSADSKPEIPDPEHDPHLPPPAGLPASVLVGLALLPFAIPLLWLVAPHITGQEATLSLAVPVSLAIAASALCLGVVYTIDWSAATRIKGVLMLLGLSYLSAAGLYFLKKDLMDRVQNLGREPHAWKAVSSKEGDCSLKMPGQVWVDQNGQPLNGVVQMADVRRANYAPDPFQDGTGPKYDYWFAVSKADPTVKPDNAWFAGVGEKLQGAGVKLERGPEAITHRESPNAPGRQWTFKLDNSGNTRIVQVYVIKSRVYYLSAEGPDLTPAHEEYGKPFFGDFLVNIE
jgi:hypothetical protein